jgi:hypothetical protein
MDKNCSNYEGYFVFSDNATFYKHLDECEECKQEHTKMQKVSNLISEVKQHYIKRKNRVRKMQAACAVLLLLFFGATFGVVSSDGDLTDALMYGNTLSAEDLGFPVDSYGLLMVDE